MKTSQNEQEKAAIQKALEDYYFQGIYLGDMKLLTRIFHPETLLFGDIKGEPYNKTLQQYLHGVANRVSPKNSEKPFETEILSIQVINSIAVATVRVKMYTFHYYDLLSFHKIDHTWMVVNKMLTHVDE